MPARPHTIGTGDGVMRSSVTANGTSTDLMFFRMLAADAPWYSHVLLSVSCGSVMVGLLGCRRALPK